MFMLILLGTFCQIMCFKFIKTMMPLKSDDYQVSFKITTNHIHVVIINDLHQVKCTLFDILHQANLLLTKFGEKVKNSNSV